MNEWAIQWMSDPFTSIGSNKNGLCTLILNRVIQLDKNGFPKGMNFLDHGKKFSAIFGITSIYAIINNFFKDPMTDLEIEWAKVFFKNLGYDNDRFKINITKGMSINELFGKKFKQSHVLSDQFKLNLTQIIHKKD